ncbi:MAG: amidohydrolase [Ornithinimicrobium sp.]|uniref:amidohydrolase n=1 Tax=Ornithinimicrobium sp. TaxID=1977084 RepID=UPI0026E0B04E|nr:amidohydrolase [Ornithinimicrobium sp.]MDO5738801.1 amidohydrolase [Ornithinimicrobium sp.]
MTLTHDLAAQVLTWHAWLDAHPEPAWREHETTAYLVEQFAAMGIPSKRVEGRTGAIAELGEGPRWVAVRADLDAIWMGGDDGYAVHSCGHSAHMAVVLGAALLLRDRSLPEGVGVRFLLQPAEETGTGALELIERGALDGVRDLFGLHLRPIEELENGRFAPALHSGASVTGIVTISGEDAHGARPHLGHNAIDPLIALHQVLSTIRYAPGESYSAKITRIRAGGASLNVIPGIAEAAIDVRAQRNEVIEGLQERISEAASGIAATYGVTVDVVWRDGTPGAEVHPEAAATLAVAIREVAGEDAFAEEIITPGADDFHYYSFGRPELRSAMLAVGVGLTPGLHVPTLKYETGPLPTAAKILARAIELAAQRD